MANFKIYTLALILITTTITIHSLSVDEAVQRGVLQIQPSALSSLRHHFDDLVVLLYNGSSQNMTSHPLQNEFLNLTNLLKEIYPRESRLFGMIDTRDDVTQSLKPFVHTLPSIQIFTKNRNYEYPLTHQQISGFVAFYADSVLPALSVKKVMSDIPSNTLIFSFTNESEYKAHHKTYLKLHQELENYGVGAVAVESSTNSIRLKADSYPDGYVNYMNELDNVVDILDFVNVETLPLVTELTEINYARVFGSQVDVILDFYNPFSSTLHLLLIFQRQLLMIYNESIQPESLRNYTKTLEAVAHSNKYNELKYERLLFAKASMGFTNHLFGDLFEDLEGSQVKILITCTDYANFQLDRYLFNKLEITEETLKEFIEDFRMKRISPHFRSEVRPNNQGRHILKIVGKTFTEAIYKSRESVLVLFYDSKDPAAHEEWNTTLVNFEKKYRDLLPGKLLVGTFDLALNQHETLHLQYAPQLVLFEKSNKKKAKSYRGEMTVEAVTEWLNYWVKDLNIPEHYGEKPLALGDGQVDSPAISAQL